MKKRNLILIGLAVTLVMVFAQIGAMAVPSACVLVPNDGCGTCPGDGAACFAGDVCGSGQYWACCNWAQSNCEVEKIHDNTKCGLCCNS